MNPTHWSLIATCKMLVVACVASGCANQVEVSSESSGTGGQGGRTSSTHIGSSSTGTPDIGQPSDVYPAPHSAPPTAVNLGGPTVESPSIYPVLFAQDHANMKSKIADFMSKVAGSSYWTKTTAEYGIGPAESNPPIVMNEWVSGTIDDADIQSWLTGKLNANDPKFPVVDDNTVFAVFYPEGVTVSVTEGAKVRLSCADFGGYHSNVTLDDAHGQLKVPYAIIPRCPTFFKTFTGLDAVTAPASHELIEVATDPFAKSAPAFEQPDQENMYWAFAVGGGEVGDLCAQNAGVFTKISGLDYVVQRTWSNESAAAGHDPCVPALPDKPYFNAAPVLPDSITLGGYSVKGVRIPVGQSSTIDIQLFSDAPMDPWQVKAIDSSELQGGPKTLSFSFDADTGQNGQTLHLTMKVLSPTVYNAEVFYLQSSSGDQHNTWIALVGN